MIKPCLVLLLLAGGMAGCQSQSTPTATVQTATSAEAARAAVATYLKSQPNTNLYQLDSARVMDADANWQVHVPRTDWAGRMPNAAAFEVNKETGAITTLKVK